MADISKATLKNEIHEILKDADLAKMSLKKVLQELEKTHGAEIRKRKAEIDEMLMEYVDNQSEKDEKKQSSESEEESEEEVKKPKRRAASTKKAAAKPVKRAGGTKGKGTGFTRSYKLSPALSALMGEDEMPRHAVVKRIWAMVKENNLYDPNNKQFAICDDALFKVIGKQRFRVFGMMKYLKTHFILD